MFLNRGMLQAAGSEGEVAGVMAHELSHVILRHGTAQASKGQKFQIGAVAGQILGAIVGGRTGSVIAQGSQIGLGTYFLKYGREYERQADLLGAQIMARAGYDPRQMARMFERIERQGGGRGPEWLSDHPNPGNRVEAINREAESLRVDAPWHRTATSRRPLTSQPDARGADVAGSRLTSGAESQTTGRATSGRNIRVEPPSGKLADLSARRLHAPERSRQLGTDRRRFRHGDLRTRRRLLPRSEWRVDLHARRRGWRGARRRRRQSPAADRTVVTKVCPEQPEPASTGWLFAHIDRWSSAE